MDVSAAGKLIPKKNCTQKKIFEIGVFIDKHFYKKMFVCNLRFYQIFFKDLFIPRILSRIRKHLLTWFLGFVAAKKKFTHKKITTMNGGYNFQ